MKARNIIAADGTQSESFAVARHIILKNFWEYYVEENKLEKLEYLHLEFSLVLFTST